jgi:hypothetical protein
MQITRKVDHLVFIPLARASGTANENAPTRITLMDLFGSGFAAIETIEFF